MTGPVRATITTEISACGASFTDTIEIDRDDWTEMTPQERSEYLSERAEELALSYVTWGWSLGDPSDYSDTAG